MSRRRAAIVTAGVAAGAVASGVVGRAVLSRRRRPDPEALEDLLALPTDDLGTVTSFDGTELAVRAAGNPAHPVLLFVHGFSLDMTTWHYQWTALSDRYRCVLFDFRSHGRSARAASGDLSPAAFGLDLAAVLDAVVPDGHAVVIGHSMGGMSILATAHARPDLFAGRVTGAVFVGTASSDLLLGVMGSVTGLLRPRLGSLFEVAQRVNRLRRHVLSSRADLSHLFMRMTQFGPEASPALVDHIAGLSARAPSDVWTDGFAGLMDMDLRDAVRHVRVPALVIVGEHDRVTPPAAAVQLTAALPEGRLELIAGAGHLPMLERHEEFNAKIRAFAGRMLTATAAKAAKPAKGAKPAKPAKPAKKASGRQERAS
jgi:pimeloyl-ACP methyl ester carboxylesterase